MELLLSRFCYSEMGVFGEMTVGDQRLFTVEQPWRNNTPTKSCIPIGEYQCVPRRYHRGGYDAIEIKDVPGRSHILFHKANLASQLAGCIAPGYVLGYLNGSWAVLDSGKAFEHLMSVWGGKSFRLRIDQYQEK